MKPLQLSKILLLVLSTTLFIYSCSSDDSGNTNNDPSLEEQRAETIQFLTNNSNKTWRISQAVLTNTNSTIDISSNFNIVDDEFIFTAEGSLEWRQGHDINIEGTSSQETLLDYYRSSINSTLNFIQDSSSELTAIDGRLSINVVDETTINGVITYTGGEINVVLTEKQAGDYATPSSVGLNFTEAFTFQSNGIASFAPSLIGSYSQNSIYLSTREDAFNDGVTIPERVIKFNIATGTQEENLFFNDDFVSKELSIVNNKLVVIGGQYINTYSLDFSTDTNSILHGLAISRFGTAVNNDDAYIIGGDLSQEIAAEKIYKWNFNNQTLEYVTDLPEDRFGARSTIVNDKLYVFGGTTVFSPSYPDATNSIFIYDLNTGDLISEQMTSVADYTYVDKFQNLIYTGGYRQVFDTDGTTTIDFIFTIGVYNTENGTYQELDTNLSQEGFNNIYGMCVLNGKMYVIYGLFSASPPDLATYQIMSADL